ncbi:hypothetical protein LPE509_00683 [Legionella pneumophila subsp. pneumophila LPE509]|nr:hypothetical protein LPE509_00683 [Legionella pneumophila subsp. pneumophila LPE509]
MQANNSPVSRAKSLYFCIVNRNIMTTNPIRVKFNQVCYKYLPASGKMKNKNLQQ